MGDYDQTKRKYLAKKKQERNTHPLYIENGFSRLSSMYMYTYVYTCKWKLLSRVQLFVTPWTI